MVQVRALTFDVFGTVVDWRGSVLRELIQFGRRQNLQVDWESFADDWRAGYGPAMDRVRRGDLPWTSIDDLHLLILQELLARYGITGLAREEIQHLNRAWHRLEPWADAAPGLLRLKRLFVIASLSNGNIALLVNMARHGGLPWDCVLSAELFRCYKPDAEVYLGAASLLALQPEAVMMVAAHKDDLVAARQCGFQTAFVPRPREFGSKRCVDVTPEPWMDVVAEDFVALAAQLGA
jgi:2-haloacid dehalogenase